MNYALYPDVVEATLQRYISQDERDTIPESDFAWPEEHKYPIRNQDELDSAATLVGRAPEDKQSSIKERATAIAKRKGLSLPESWKEGRVEMPEVIRFDAPITRIDNDKWEVEGVATSEALDSYGTVFSYDARKRAFQKWIDRTANVREMHDRKAVGKGIGVFFDDANKQVVVRSRVSRGARDTWTKIQEGVLSGYSVSASPKAWSKVERDGKKYPYLTDYDLVELSYVDNASNPDGHGLTICRADGLSDEIIDVTPEPEQTEPPQDTNPSVLSSSASEERAGARLSSGSRGALHQMRDQAMSLCGCDECTGMTNRSQEPEFSPQETLERAISPVLYRFQGLLARLAQSDAHYDQIEQRLTKLDEITVALERVASTSSLDEVRAELSAVKGLAEKIAAQPASGGPVLNGARPIDKHLATDPQHAPASGETPEEMINRLHRQGAFSTLNDQIAAAAVLMQPMPRRG